MSDSKIEMNDPEKLQRIQETKVSKTTTGPGETSVKSGQSSGEKSGKEMSQNLGQDSSNNSDSKLASNAESQKGGANPDTSGSESENKAEPGDLNEV